MKRTLTLILLAVAMLWFTGCMKTVPAGSVGVKVYLLGTNKGVDNQVLGTGRYFLGLNEEIYIYPTYQINYVFTRDKNEGSETNEEFTFQTIEGMECAADIGVSVAFQKDKIASIFQTYRKNIHEIREVVIRTEIRDAMNNVASTMGVESVYGSGKTKFIEDVTKLVKSRLDSKGIVVEKISLVGSIRFPKTVKDALDAKVTATQKAQQRENELREAEAQAKKLVAEAQGTAEANRIKASSLTATNLEWEKLQIERDKIAKWNGAMPATMIGGNTTPMITLK
jgi:regulator of protease activity HflC (stomatin/prohibitin superfamily)